MPVVAGEIKQLGNGSEGRLPGGLAEPVPGTNILTGIAAEHPVAEMVFHVFRDQHFFELDGKIRNAFASVDHFFLPDGAGWAGFYASAAGAAIIFGKGIIVG